MAKKTNSVDGFSLIEMNSAGCLSLKNSGSADCLNRSTYLTWAVKTVSHSSL